MKDFIRIASGQGFWGDLPNAPVNQVKKGPIDYLVLDYLAEVTMSILQKQKTRNSSHGYARDFIDVIKAIIPDIAGKGVKVITNAGGMNPESCKDAVISLIKEQGYGGIKVGVVDGDDILSQIDTLIENGYPLNNMDTGKPVHSVKERLLSANVYFGCPPVVDALKRGADIIITGRVTDPGLSLAAMVYEFDWSLDDYDKLAAGTVAGHIIECGAQASGGNFTDWEMIGDFIDIGFPIIEAHPSGELYVTKHDGTGGLVSEMTVKEQLLYEIGDPTRYLTPDVIADFTSISLESKHKNKVRLYGIKGHPPTDSYKISASYKDGFKISSSLVYSWPKPLKKAMLAAEILKRRAEKLTLFFDEFRVEYVGVNSCSEKPITDEQAEADYDEIQIRVSVSGPSKQDLDRFGKEIVPLILTGPGGVTGYAGGRPKASEIVAYWPALLDKQAVRPRVRVFKV